MKKTVYILFLSIIFLQAETLFEVKDASNNKVLDVSTDGLRVMNQGDTLMVISSDAIRANIGQTSKGLSRSFCISTASSKGKGIINALEVDAGSTMMREGIQGQKYTDFSPDNIFLGLNAGRTVSAGINNVMIGNETASNGGQLSNSVFIGDLAGKKTYGEANVFVGSGTAQNNTSGGYNTYIGWWSGANNNGSRNVCIGPWTCLSALGDVNDDNVLIGYNAGWSLHGSGNILIGNGISGSTYNNRLNIGDLITGDMYATTRSVTSNGTLTSTGLLTTNNNLRILTAPGSANYPAYYAYQGSIKSTTKSNAFAINDAFWIKGITFADSTVYLEDNSLLLRSDSNHGLRFADYYDSFYLNGPLLYGYEGGGLGTAYQSNLTLKWDWAGNVFIPSLYTTTTSNSKKALYVDSQGKLCVAAKSDEEDSDIQRLSVENKKLKEELSDIKRELEEIKMILNKN
jgi:hypothetical protein